MREKRNLHGDELLALGCGIQEWQVKQGTYQLLI